jgi:hypothetical protein
MLAPESESFIAGALRLPDETRVQVVIHGKEADTSVRDIRQAKDCRFTNCRNRWCPCSEHPRTEWGK